MNIAKNKILMRGAQRMALSITTTPCGTISHASLFVLSGNMPIYIKTRLRKEMYDKTKNPKKLTGIEHGVDNPNTLMLKISNIINNKKSPREEC